MIGRIRTSCTCWRRDKKLAIPAEWASTKRVIRLCRRSRAAVRRRERGLLDPFRRTNGDGQQHERNARDMAWSKARAGGLPYSVSSVTSCRIAPPLHYFATPFPPKFPATFAVVFLCMGWRPVASPRKRRSGKKRIWIRTINTGCSF
jgi:hypothetical protein